jgi:hypothetical protein
MIAVSPETRAGLFFRFFFQTASIAALYDLTRTATFFDSGRCVQSGLSSTSPPLSSSLVQGRFDFRFGCVWSFRERFPAEMTAARSRKHVFVGFF